MSLDPAASSPAHSPAPFVAGDWLVRPRRLCLVRGTEERTVTPKVMDLLVFLAEHSGTVVTKDELMDAVWPGVYVSEGAVRRTISHLRQALEDDAQAPRYVETVPRTGYVFIAPVGPPPLASPNAVRTGMPPSSTAETGRAKRTRAWTVLAGMLVVLGVGSALGLWLRPPTPPPAPLVAVSVTTFHGDEVAPSLAPDARRIAFTHVQPHAPGVFRGDLFIKGTEAETTLQLTNDAAFETSTTWSPDGLYLAFVRLSEDRCGIYRIAAIGGPARRLAPCTLLAAGRPPTLSWSPDGRSLAFARPAPGEDGASLYRVTVGLPVEERLTTPPKGTYDYLPAFSPDGRSLAFVRVHATGETVLSTLDLAAASRTLRPLYTHATPIWGVQWSGDGTSLYFFADGDNQSVALWKLSRHGGLLKRIILPPEAHSAGDFEIREDRLVFAAVEGEADLWHIDSLDSLAAARQPCSSTRLDLLPGLSRDGRRVAFFSDRTGRVSLWTCRMDGNERIEVAAAEGTDLTAPTWSPDEAYVLYGSSRGLFEVEIATGIVRRLTGVPVLSVAYAPDGARYVTAVGDDGRQVLHVHPDGSTFRASPHGSSELLRWVDDDYLYVTPTAHPTRLLQRPRTGGEAATLYDTVSLEDAGQTANWAVTQEGVYFLSHDPPATAWFFDWATAQRRLVHTFRDGQPRTLTASADGRRLLVDLEHVRRIDLMLVDGLANAPRFP